MEKERVIDRRKASHIKINFNHLSVIPMSFTHKCILVWLSCIHSFAQNDGWTDNATNKIPLPLTGDNKINVRVALKLYSSVYVQFLSKILSSKF